MSDRPHPAATRAIRNGEPYDPTMPCPTCGGSDFCEACNGSGIGPSGDTSSSCPYCAYPCEDCSYGRVPALWAYLHVGDVVLTERFGKRTVKGWLLDDWENPDTKDAALLVDESPRFCDGSGWAALIDNPQENTPQ